MQQNKELVLPNLLDSIKELIKFKTVDGNFKEFEEAVSYVENFFIGTNINVEKLYFNNYPAIVITTKGNKKPEIMLQGHLDVVNGNDEQFTPKVIDDKLYGRGSVDMKGFDAIALHLIKNLYQEYEDIDLGLMLTFDEEIGSLNGASKLAELGYSGDMLINGDGGYNFAVIHGEKGILKFEMEVDANPGRHPYPWNGKNAFDLLMEDYQRITSLFPNNNTATENNNWHSTYSIYDIEVDNKEFYPAHKASAKINIYFADEYSVSELLLKIKHLTENVSIKKITGSERVFLDPNQDKVLQLQQIMQKNFDEDIIIRTENGSSDARYFTNKGIPIVIVKVVGEDFHGDNEHLDIPSLMPLYNSLKEFILSNVSVNVSKSNEVITNEV